ncbi:PaaI family thioesterase [Raoultibacter phocaeensis]|uniref:PaaI family thioesterase n=1 Tax=Raoultibacter phocaeensis TaxID=2479841 RepID=UPI00111A8D69|nr:YiiD C-terminal domain-containing protein [Raoultibacter phocaeensis]
MDQEFFEGLAKSVNDGPTPYVNMADLQAEVVEERHVRLVLPVAERHLNHVGIAYAGSEFVLAEISGGTLFMATYGTDTYVPILKGVDIKFLKPGTKDLVVDIALTEEEAADKIKEVEERGRGNYFLTVPVCDVDGEQVAQFDFNYYALPAQK